MATDTQEKSAAQAGFIDLYELLKLPTDADNQALRKRINEYYLEAQQNLDHRNAKKRLHFQQMFEVYLPQARHLLLDPSRRAEYDRYVVAFRTGSNVVPLSAEERAQVAATSTGTDVLPEMTAQGEAESAVTAAKREELWNKWKLDLEKALQDEEARNAEERARREAEKAAHRYADPSAVEQQGVQTAAGGYPIGGGAVVGGKAKSFDNAPHGVYGNKGEVKVRRSWSVEKGTEEQKAQEAVVADKERERQKRAMLEKKAEAQSQTWGVGAAVGAFVLTFLISAYLLFPAIEDMAVIEKLFDMVPTSVVALVVAGIAAWQAKNLAGELGRKQVLATLPQLDEPGKKAPVGGPAGRPVLTDYSNDPKAQAAGRVWGIGAAAAFLIIGYLALSVALFPSFDKKGPDIQFSNAGQTPFGGKAHAIPGTIEAENFDMGASGAAYYDDSTDNYGKQYRNTGVDVGELGGNNFKIGWSAAGEWLEYTVDVAASGYYNITLTVAADNASKDFALYCNGKDITGPVAGLNTEGWDKWKPLKISAVYLPAGLNVLTLKNLESGPDGGPRQDYDKFVFEPAGFMDTINGTERLLLLLLLILSGAVGFFAAQTGRQKAAETLRAEAAAAQAKAQKTA